LERAAVKRDVVRSIFVRCNIFLCHCCKSPIVGWCARLIRREGLEREENQGSNESAESRAAENQSASFAFHLFAFRSMFD
jgi:hypothetical protein